ncbi:uncharacterized protein TrAtP1_000954 [Trichoderma atroviride]|uniref:uncharacterized protein n=1 Tax=Hypocrea atroviridis TaxID=63577 RepID=UPI00331BB05E|nr:hypothetical protein TrAtP1_000954 [Trichoderma atroviride]
MLAPSYSFVLPFPSADEYNDFVTHFPLSPLLRLSTTSTSLSSRDSERTERPGDESKTAKMLRRKWQTLIDGRKRSRGYKLIGDEGRGGDALDANDGGIELEQLW